MLNALRSIACAILVCLGLAGAAYGQASPCAYAIDTWRTYGETTGSLVGNYDPGNPDAQIAYAYLAAADSAKQVLINCPPGEAPFTQQQISEVVRRAAKSLMFCAQLSGPPPAPLSRLDFLKDYVHDQRPKQNTAVTPVEVTGFQLNGAEYLYWDARLADLGSDPTCAQTIKLPELKAKLAAIKTDLEEVERRVKAAESACQTDARAFEAAASDLAQKNPAPADAIKERDGLAPQKQKALTSCAPFPAGALTLQQISVNLDMALAKAVPACLTIMQAASPAYVAGQTAAKTRDSNAAKTAQAGFATALAAAQKDCSAYPGYIEHLKNVSAEVSQIAVNGK